MPHASGLTRARSVSGAIVLGFASLASAQSAVIVGGGATFPSPAYAGDPSQRLMTPSPGTFLYAYDGANAVASTYCQTGNDGGKNVLVGAVRPGNAAPDAANIACISPVPPTAPLGFGGSLAQAQFAGSDVPLSGSDFSAYMASAAHTVAGSSPVQIPSVAAAVAIVFNKPEINQLKLSEAQVCQIFSGQIKHWEDPALSSAIALKPGRSLAPGSMNLVYRSDRNGASFALTNHLSVKCGSAPNGNGIATAFTADQSYVASAGIYLSNYTSSAGASGDTSMIEQVVNSEGSIGYADASHSIFGGSQRALVANDAVPSNFIDPFSFGSPMAVSVMFDKVIGASGPTLTTLPSTPGVANCIAVVDPSTYAVPTSGYPIVGISYFLAHAKGNGLDVPHVRSLLLSPYSAPIRAATTNVGPGTGVSWLTAPAVNPLPAHCIGT